MSCFITYQKKVSFMMMLNFMMMLKKSFQFPIYQKLVEAIAQQGTDDVRSCTGGSWWLSFWSCTSWSYSGESIILQMRGVFVSLFVYLTRKRRDHIEYAWINMAVAWSTPYCCFYDTQVNIGTLVDCLWYHQHIALHCKKIILHQWTLLHPKRSCCVICERAYCCWRIYHTICKGKKHFTGHWWTISRKMKHIGGGRYGRPCW